MNALCNRFYYLNDKIPLEWLYKPLPAYEIERKKLFLTHQWIHIVWLKNLLNDIYIDFNYFFKVIYFTGK
jgi:hypothetical protein